MSPRSTSAIASTTSSTGSEIEIDTRIIARSPRTTATSASTSRASSIGVDLWMIQPLVRMISSDAIAMPGSAVHTAHMISSLARTPGAVIGDIWLKSPVTPANSGRRVRNVNRNPVHTVAMAPNRMAEATTTCTSGPSVRFSGIITAALSTHGATVIADCRRSVLSAVSPFGVGRFADAEPAQRGPDDEDRTDRHDGRAHHDQRRRGGDEHRGDSAAAGQ